VSLLNCHRAVFPLRFGSPGEPDHWSVSDWCDQCHRKKGLVVWPDLPRVSEDHPEGEALAAVVLGKIDAFEIGPESTREGESLRWWYRLLDCGLRPVLVGGSGKDANAVALGAVRTYAQLLPGQELQPATWIEAVRSGRTFITSGPLLLALSVAGQGPGGVVNVTPGQAVSLRAEARSALPLERLELLAAGGTVIGAGAASGDRRTMVVETPWRPQQSTWVAARCAGECPPGATGSFAHTNAVYLQVPDRPVRPVADTLAPLLAVLGRTLGWVENEATCATERQRQHLREVLLAARGQLLGLQIGD
jgi:hypothetical protein